MPMNLQVITNKINEISADASSLGTDYSDANYDKYSDIIVRINDILDAIAQYEFPNATEIAEVISLLRDVLKPTIDVLRTFSTGRTDHLKELYNDIAAEHDAGVLTGSINDMANKIDESVNGLVNNVTQIPETPVQSSVQPIFSEPSMPVSAVDTTSMELADSDLEMPKEIEPSEMPMQDSFDIPSLANSVQEEPQMNNEESIDEEQQMNNEESIGEEQQVLGKPRVRTLLPNNNHWAA